MYSRFETVNCGVFNSSQIVPIYSPEYAKYSSDEEEDDEEVLGEPFVKEREIDEQEMNKVLILSLCLIIHVYSM